MDKDDKARMEAPKIFRILGKHRPEFVRPYLEQLQKISETDDNRVVRIHRQGAIELKLNGHTDMTERDDECELGYWLGKPFWGQGIIPEAVCELLRHAFEDIGMTKV